MENKGKANMYISAINQNWNMTMFLTYMNSGIETTLEDDFGSSFMDFNIGPGTG